MAEHRAAQRRRRKAKTDVLSECAIAILALIPFNYFSRRLAQLQFELESAATNIEVMVGAAKQKGFDTIEFRKPTESAMEVK